MDQNQTGGDKLDDLTENEKQFTYAELSDRAKDNVRDEFYSLYDDWWEYPKEQFMDFIHRIGNGEMEEIDVHRGQVCHWSGHIYIEASRIADLESNYCAEKEKEIIDKMKTIAALFSFVKNSYTDDQMEIWVANGKWDDDNLWLDGYEDDGQSEAMRGLCSELVSDMTDMFFNWYKVEEEYRSSEEYLLEAIEANDWKFTEEGDFIY